jgi:hypothetical protein
MSNATNEALPTIDVHSVTGGSTVDYTDGTNPATCNQLSYGFLACTTKGTGYQYMANPSIGLVRAGLGAFQGVFRQPADPAWFPKTGQ